MLLKLDLQQHFHVFTLYDALNAKLFTLFTDVQSHVILQFHFSQYNVEEIVSKFKISFDIKTN